MLIWEWWVRIYIASGRVRNEDVECGNLQSDGWLLWLNWRELLVGSSSKCYCLEITFHFSHQRRGPLTHSKRSRPRCWCFRVTRSLSKLTQGHRVLGWRSELFSMPWSSPLAWLAGRCRRLVDQSWEERRGGGILHTSLSPTLSASNQTGHFPDIIPRYQLSSST